MGYQLKQVRERLAKGLVDKGVLRTEKKNFVLFDMATHPVSDASVKEDLIARVVSTLLGVGMYFEAGGFFIHVSGVKSMDAPL